MRECVLGLDGGGTKTSALVMARDGMILGRGTAGPCNVAAVLTGEALAAAMGAAEVALAAAGRGPGDVRAVCAGIAGFSHAERRALFLAGLQDGFPGVAISVEPDYAVALAGATEGKPGIVVISGTGSVAFGENGNGEAHRAGAYGYLIDDAGSGYGVGRSALAAVLRAADGTGEGTTLAQRLLVALGFASVAEIIPAVYGGALDRLAVAALAPLVADAAREDHDAVARAILMRAGGALARLAEAVSRQLFPEPAVPYAVSPVGSLWHSGPTLSDVFARSLARFAPAAEFSPPRHAPAHGAALRALSILTRPAH